MKIEQCNYPYIPGVGGIDFTSIPFGAINDYLITGGSGQLLSCRSNQWDLAVRDHPFGGFFLSAHLEGRGDITFGLRTRREIGETVVRQPDMFAAKFYPVAFKYFENLGINIVAVQGKWHIGSDNHIGFMQNYGKSTDIIQAAFSTWSGRQALRYGFSNLSEKDVYISPDGSLVTARFIKS